MTALFYSNPVLINSAAHAEAGLKTIEKADFAREGNAIPLNLPEFALAARHYPIAFVGEGSDVHPAVIVGLEAGNLFVDTAGDWKSGAYVPAYVRRYPFIFADQEGSDILSLCVDDVPAVMDPKGGSKLFEDGKPTAAVNQALEFCKAYHAAALATRPFVEALLDKDMLVERQADTELAEGSKFTLRGFRTIDEGKLLSLDGATLEEWSKKGWLAAAYAQVQSTLNWGELIDLLAAQKTGDAASSKKPTAPASGSKKLAS